MATDEYLFGIKRRRYVILKIFLRHDRLIAYRQVSIAVK